MCPALPTASLTGWNAPAAWVFPGTRRKFSLARTSIEENNAQPESLSMDRAARRLARLGLRRIRRFPLQLCGTELRACVASSRDRQPGSEAGDTLLDRAPDLAAAAGLGRR